MRGLPVFNGYLTPTGIDRSAFDTAGWFDTGDLGRIDEVGYLYITGRSKEVINRGGEIISPLEVEDAIIFSLKGSLVYYLRPRDRNHGVLYIPRCITGSCRRRDCDSCRMQKT